MARDIFIVHDPGGEAPSADIAPERMRTGCLAVCLQPTPGNSKDQLVDDLLSALGRRPRLAMRWSDRAMTDAELAGAWCSAHGIRHVVVARAHTLDRSRIGEFIRTVTSHTSYRGVMSWWLIDSSDDGILDAKLLGAVRSTIERLRNEIADTHDASEHAWRSELAPHVVPRAPRFTEAAVSDAHPALMAARLRRTLPPEERDAARQRMQSVAAVIDAAHLFSDWRSSVWYCLRAARDPADALVILRAAQLQLLKKRTHLDMREDPWRAAQAAQAQVTDQVSQLLVYVDPLVAAIGALGMQTGFKAGALAALGGTEIELDAVPRVDGFDAGEMDNSIITLVRPQLDIWRAAGKPQRLLIRYRRQPDAGFPRPADTAPATAARITAILRTLEIERGVRFDHADWANHQGIALQAL